MWGELPDVIFPVLLCLQQCTEPPSSEGAMDGSKAFKLHINEGILWAYQFPSTTRSKGGVCGSASMVQLDPIQVVPAGRRERRRRGGSRTPRRRPSGAAPTSPPEGVFRHKRRMVLVELSGRITGRLGYDYRLCHRRDGMAGTTILYHLRIYRRPHSPSGTPAGRRELLEDGHRRRFRRGRRTFRGTTGRTSSGRT